MDGFAPSLLLSQLPAPGGIEPWMSRETLILTIIAAVFTVPFLVGWLIARLLKLPDLSKRIGTVLMVISMSLAPFAYEELRPFASEAEKLRGKNWTNAFHLGIDLAGGTDLVYALNVKEAREQKKVVDTATVDRMVASIKRRVNPSGTIDMTVRGVGTEQIEVIVPGADRDLVEQMKAQIVKLGSLEFGILANMVDHRHLIDPARRLPDKVRTLMDDNRIVAMWRDAAKGKMDDDRDDQVATRKVKKLDKDGKEVEVLQFLLVQGKKEETVTGDYLTAARVQQDRKSNPSVGFNFNAHGAILFGRLTGANQPDAENGPTKGFSRRLAILLDGEVNSAPNIQSRIQSAGEITGRFSMKEVKDLVAVLNAGALEIPLIPEPISEFTVSALLGKDVKQKGMMAIAFSAFVVFAFMLVYYRTAGLVADLSLALNLLMVVGSMAFIAATFTLPGLAGIVLTIGMAVDSNVLIYERMREELARGASLRIAIQNGFDKAFSAIFDGNVASLLTAVILYMIGSDLIRGFAVTLFLGLLMSLFSCLYFGHLAFDIIERKRLVKTLPMMQFLGETKIDFLAKRGIAFAASGLVIAAGFGALLVRGSDNLDIDFSGGQTITFEFVKEQETKDVKQRLDDAFPGVSLEQLAIGDEKQSSEGGRRFRMRTTEQSPEVLIAGMNNAFGDAEHALKRVTLADFQVDPVTEKLEGEAVRFAGGHQATLQFSGGVSEANVIEYVSKKLADVKLDAKGSKYESVQLLLSARGIVAAADSAASNPTFVEVILRATREIDPDDLNSALKGVQTRLASTPLFEGQNKFNTAVANDTKLQALLAILASLVMIVGYIWLRFEKVYFGYAAVVALAHDVLVTVGCIALGGYLSKTPIGPLFMLDDFKINLNQIACLLTIVGYSLNDTIVIFDRIREIKGKSPKITPEMINLSVNQTLSRTLLTALSTFMVVVVLYIAGGEGIHGFAFSMIVGVITGCYSTVYIANPVLLWLVQREEALAKKTPAGQRALAAAARR